MRFPSFLLALLTGTLLAAGCGGTGSGEQAAKPSARLSTGRAPAGSTAVKEAGPILKRADFDLSQYKGEVVLLNFWATWCAPCRAEMPDLVELQQDLGSEGLQIVGVATDRQGREAVGPYLKRQPVNYPVVLDPQQEIGADYGGVAALPTTLVIGRGGEVKDRIVGRVRPGPLRERLKSVLAEESGRGSTASGAS